jgi:regulator of sigma E protease
MTTLILVSQLILSLSILVTLHEMGHFFPARFFGMRVDKFYLFFDPWFSLYKVKKGETEYGVGWLPLGGYVKIAGMVDESMDTEALAQEPQEWEFRSKPAWQRLIVMLGGVIVNFLLGFFIFAMLLWTNGREYLPTKNAIYGITCDSIGKSIGLQDGDKILKINEVAFERVDARLLIKEIVVGDTKSITVERGGEMTKIDLPSDVVSRLSTYKGQLFAARFPFVLDSVMVGKLGDKSGLKKGDSLVALNGTNLAYFHEFAKALGEQKEKEISLGYYRAGELKEAKIQLGADGKLSVIPRLLPTERETFGFWASLPEGASDGVGFIGAQLKAFGKMFSGEIKASESLGGFISIGSLFPSTWDWAKFWYITGALSLILGFMNLLPIPALDGGHAVFLIIEMIIRRPLPQKFMEYAQIIGILLLLSLMVFANGMDIYKWFVGK